MDGLGAFNPLSSLDTESLDDIGSFEELVNVGEIVTERRIGALFSNVVDIESGLSGVETQNAHDTDLTFFHGNQPRNTRLDHLLASPESTLQDTVLDLTDQIVFKSEVGVFGVLLVGGNQTVTDGGTSELNPGVVLGDNLSTDGGDVVTCIRFTSDEELSTLEFSETGVETLQELPEIVSDLGFVVGEFVEADSAVASTDGLVNKNDVGVGVPRVGVGGESEIIVDLVGTIFGKETSDGRATGTTIQPDDEGISRGAGSRVELPIENVAVLSDLDETGVVGFIQEDGVLVSQS